MYVNLDRSLETSLTRQLYNDFRQRILQGEWRAGEKLPSTRELAGYLQISRNVVLEAYELLTAEGFIYSIPSSGIYVAPGAYLAHNPVEPLKVTPEGKEENTDNLIDFRPGLPALDVWQRGSWVRLVQRVYQEMPPAFFGYDNPEGNYELRAALCNYLKRTRGVICEPEQILITSGAIQAFNIVAQVLLRPGSVTLIEEPSNYSFQRIFGSYSEIYPVPVDEMGLITEKLPEDIQPDLIFVTPSHQFPLGGVLPIQRRVELIEYIRSHGCYVIEDDYDSEFRYEGQSVSSLQGLEPNRVIYVGTFSKVFFPGLRLAYMVVPWELVDKCRVRKRLNDHNSMTVNQLALAYFIKEGLLDKYLNKTRKTYRQRRDRLISLLTEELANFQPIIMGKSTGLHLVAGFPGLSFDESVVQKAKLAGLVLHPVENHTLNKGLHQDKIIMGYGHLASIDLEKGIKILKSLLQDMK